MATFQLSDRDIDRLRTVDFRLALVVGRAAKLSPMPFTVAQARRTEAEQRALVAAGKSETMHSMHLVGRAVDLVILTDHRADWHWGSYVELNHIMQLAAMDVGHHVLWGGNWHSIKDGDHWQLTAFDPEPLVPWPADLSSTSSTRSGLEPAPATI